jgi:hypothetical protein
MYQEHTLLFMEGKYKYVAPGCAERRYPRHITTRAGNLQDAQRCHAWKLIWKTWAPPRVKLFLWLANKDRCWTAEWLQQRHLQNNWCVMCDQQLETIHHLLVSCPFSRQIWYDTLSWLRLACRPPDQDDSISHWWLDVRQNTTKAMRKGLATRRTSQPGCFGNTVMATCSTGTIHPCPDLMIASELKRQCGQEPEQLAYGISCQQPGMYTRNFKNPCKRPLRWHVSKTPSIQWKETQSLCVFSKKKVPVKLVNQQTSYLDRTVPL